MTKTGRLGLMVAALSVVALLGSYRCEAQLPAAAIEEKLDQPVELTLRHVTLTEALTQLSQAMKVPFNVDKVAIEQLPRGGRTQLNLVQFPNIPWREALREFFKPLALRFEVGDGQIMILGTVELMRQPRRLNMVELDALRRLQNSKLKRGETRLLQQLRDVAGFMRFALVEEGQRQEKVDDAVAQEVLTSAPQLATVVLDLYSQRRVESTLTGPGVWYVRAELQEGRPDEPVDIVIVPIMELHNLKLSRRINKEFKNEPVADICRSLAAEAAIDVSFEPGCLTLLGKGLETLVVRGVDVRTALEVLSGTTGLRYEVTPEGLYFSASDELRQLAQGPDVPRRSSNPLVGMITRKLAGTDMEVMILLREDDLKPGNRRERFERFLRQGSDEFFRYLESEAFLPSGTSEP